VLGAAAIGIAATVAFAAPAEAHTASITASADCDKSTGEWVITWTVNNDYHTSMTLSNVTITPDKPITGSDIKNGTVVPSTGSHNVTGKQRVPGNTTSASLSVTAIWSVDGYIQHPAPYQKSLGGVPCTPPPSPTPSASPSPSPTPTPSVTPSAPASPTPSASTPPLPATGTKAGVYTGAALGLLGVGGALFVVARRRRITFTA